MATEHEQQDTPQEATGAPQSDAEASEAPQGQEAANGPENGSQEPEGEQESFTREYVEQLRGEAASWRKKFREAQADLQSAKSPEDYAALEQKLAEVQHQYDRDQWIAKATKNLPDDLVSSVSWPDTEDAIKSMAESIAKHVVVRHESSENLHGGLNPNKNMSEDDLSPEKLAARFNKRTRR